MSYEALCLCPRYQHWYTDQDWHSDDKIPVCRCGHPDGEHINGTGSCTGELVVYPAEKTEVAS